MARLAAMDFIKAVIVEGLTPGGSPAGSERIRATLKNFPKPIFFYASDMLASGGVWLSAGVKRIIAEPGTLVGSVGVVGSTQLTYKDVTKYGSIFQSVEAANITGRPVFAGKGKTHSPWVDPDEEVMDQEKRLLRGLHDQFKELVANARAEKGMTVEKLDEAGAAVFSSRQALEFGFIDDEMSRGDFFAHVAEEIKVPQEGIAFPLVFNQKPRSPLERMLGVEQTSSSFAPEQRLAMVLQHEPALVLHNAAAYGY